MADPGRVVVVAAGFALWTGGRCAAAARWSDVRRLRAYRRHAASRAAPPIPAAPPASAEALFLGVDLVDGTVMELHEDAPGFDAFLDRAAVTLAGLTPYPHWHPALAGAGAAGITVFERTAPRR